MITNSEKLHFQPYGNAVETKVVDQEDGVVTKLWGQKHRKTEVLIRQKCHSKKGCIVYYETSRTKVSSVSIVWTLRCRSLQHLCWFHCLLFSLTSNHFDCLLLRIWNLCYSVGCSTFHYSLLVTIVHLYLFFQKVQWNLLKVLSVNFCDITFYYTGAMTHRFGW